MALSYMFEGSRHTRTSLSASSRYTRLKEPVIVLGPGMPQRNLAYVFDNIKAFYAATSRMKMGHIFDKLKRGITEAQKAEKGDLTPIKTRQIALARRIKNDYKKLAARTGFPLNSQKLFLQATTKAPVLEGPVFDPSCVFTGPNFTGNFMCVGVPLPDLSFFAGFNNSITSVRAAGICVLFSHTWFRGASLVLVGLPIIAIANLASVAPTTGAFANFNDITSSIYLYLF